MREIATTTGERWREVTEKSSKQLINECSLWIVSPINYGKVK
jgi:hypothetical protein